MIQFEVKIQPHADDRWLVTVKFGNEDWSSAIFPDDVAAAMFVAEKTQDALSRWQDSHRG